MQSMEDCWPPKRPGPASDRNSVTRQTLQARTRVIGQTINSGYCGGRPCRGRGSAASGWRAGAWSESSSASGSTSPSAWPAHTMGVKLLYSGFETCFDPSAPKVLGSDIKIHLKSRFCSFASHFEKNKGERCNKLRLPCVASNSNIAPLFFQGILGLYI